MSALARYFNRSGFKVSGYDKTPSKLTDELIHEGIAIHFEDSVIKIPDAVQADREGSLIIYTPAVPKSHTGLMYFKSRGYDVFKRSVVLGMIANTMKTVAIAGTHGKTTTTSMIAHLLKVAEMDIVAFLGGIATNYNSNFVGGGQTSASTIAVVEADEFDRSFLTLNPDIAVVTSADADHLDIYGNADSLKDSFKAFIRKVKENGKLFINEKIASDLVDEEYQTFTSTNRYGINRGQFFASNITARAGFFVFDYGDELHNIDGLELGVPGFHNVENATVAIAVALTLGASPEKVKEGIKSYKGVKRRFEYIVKTEDIVYIDDYAHHPVEIEAFLSSLRALFPDKKLTAVFQPHLYSRTKDFAEGFAQSLNLADEVILLDIYPAREEPIPGITSEIIYKGISVGKALVSKDGLLQTLEKRPIEVLATIGAGDIDRLVEPIKTLMERRDNV